MTTSLPQGSFKKTSERVEYQNFSPEVNHQRTTESASLEYRATGNVGTAKSLSSQYAAGTDYSASKNIAATSQNENLQGGYTSPPKNLEDLSHKLSQSPDPHHTNAYVYQADSFGVHNPTGKTI